MGGSRRRNAKRSSRNSRVAKGKKGMRGGAFYGFAGALDGTGAGAKWGGVENSEVNPVTGAVVPESILPKTGGRRRRTGKKGTRKSRRSRRRTMRGGASYVGSANSGASYAGKGIGGMADYGGYAANTPGAGFNHQQVAGVWQV